MNNDNQNMVDDIINFFERFGSSNELSKRNFDTGDFFSEDYCNFILDLGKNMDYMMKLKKRKMLTIFLI